MVIYRVSNVYLSCIYRICNVVDSGGIAGNSANYRRAQNRGREYEKHLRTEPQVLNI